jgi:hypothetical protein
VDRLSDSPGLAQKSRALADPAQTDSDNTVSDLGSQSGWLAPTWALESRSAVALANVCPYKRAIPHADVRIPDLRAAPVAGSARTGPNGSRRL